VPLLDVLLPQAPPDRLVGEEKTSPRHAEQAMIVAFGLGLGSCHVCFFSSNQFISRIDYYMCCEVFRFLRVYFMYWFCISFILFIVLWDIAHAAFFQLLACNEPPRDGVETQRSLMLAERIVHLQTRLLGPGTNFCPYLQYILHSTCVVNNPGEDTSRLPRIFMPKDVHLTQLVT
jgi:hypothetical protein